MLENNPKFKPGDIVEYIIKGGPEMIIITPKMENIDYECRYFCKNSGYFAVVFLKEFELVKVNNTNDKGGDDLKTQ